MDGDGLPLFDWHAVRAWLAPLLPGGGAKTDADAAAANHAWVAAERAWLQHLNVALGEPYWLLEDEQAFVLSSLTPRMARAALAYVAQTNKRIVHVLNGLAENSHGGKDILLVFDDQDSYYRYHALYGPAGDSSLSGGCFVDAGCGHFVTRKADDLMAIEPVIAHELTHANLAHLPLPLWLNEGLAVNTEQRLAPRQRQPYAGRSIDMQLRARHQRFWGDAELQQFWNGQSFARQDEGNELSYDLARILVKELGRDWPQLRDFALAADARDGGEAAAQTHLQLSLGELAGRLLQKDDSLNPAWAPQPARWNAIARETKPTPTLPN